MSAVPPTHVRLAVALAALSFSIAEAASERRPAKIYEGKIGPYPVAVLLAELPDGNIEGCYYYTKRSPVSLLVIRGAKKGQTLNLEEYPPSDRIDNEIGLSLGKMSGRCEVSIRGHKVEGKWLGTSGGKEHKVALAEVRTKQRQSELRNTILDAYDQLNLQSTGCEEPSTRELDENGCTPLECSLTYNLKNEDVRSLNINASTTCYGAYPDTDARTVNITYEAKTLRAILLEEEIDPKRKASFEAYVRREGRKLLDAHRANTTDEDWYTLLGGGDAEPLGNGSSAEASTARRKFVDRCYAEIDPVEILAGYYVATNGVHLGLRTGWSFPHVAAALECCDSLVISPQQMTKYLKPRSILRKISK